MVAEMVAKESAKQPITAVKVWDWILRLAVPLVLLVGAVVIQVRADVQMQAEQIRSINNTLFTAADWAKAELRIMAAIQEGERRAAAERPPEWVRDDLSEIKAILRSLADKFDSHVANYHTGG